MAPERSQSTGKLNYFSVIGGNGSNLRAFGWLLPSRQVIKGAPASTASPVGSDVYLAKPFSA